MPRVRAVPGEGFYIIADGIQNDLHGLIRPPFHKVVPSKLKGPGSAFKQHALELEFAAPRYDSNNFSTFHGEKQKQTHHTRQ